MSETSKEVSIEEFQLLYQTVRTLTKRVDLIETDVTSTQRIISDIERVDESFEGFCLLQHSNASSDKRNKQQEDEEEEGSNIGYYWWCCFL
jgi:enoyl-[acyl-carrier-protein] reductase (NADH)